MCSIKIDLSGEVTVSRQIHARVSGVYFRRARRGRTAIPWTDSERTQHPVRLLNYNTMFMKCFGIAEKTRENANANENSTGVFTVY